jgi:hypothetical protein
MSFTVRLTTDLVAVEAGATVPLVVEVDNKGPDSDRFEFQIEGIDPEWTAVPEAVFVVEPGEVHAEKAFLKVPRTSESAAGNYPIVIRVRSLTSGDFRTAQGVIQVKPFHHITMELSPKKGLYAPFRKQNVYTVTFLNLGNTDHTLNLEGNDPDDACTYDFESDQITVASGQQRMVEVEVTPSGTSFLSSSRLHGFSITGRSIESPNVMATAQAQLEQRPFLTPATLTFLLFLLVIGIGWFALLPKQPTIRLALSKHEAVKGEPIQVSWQSQYANGVQILVNGNPLVTDAPLSGETEYTPTESGVVVFAAKATRDQRESPEESQSLKVSEPAPSPKPLVTLRAKRKTLNLSESVELTYTVENAVDAYLQPGPQKLPLQLNSVTVQPAKEGPNEYEIVATGKDGQVASAKVTVYVVDKAKVVILALDVKPGKLEAGGGYVTLKWQVSNAARVEITGGPETIVPENPNAAGSQEFMIDKTTTFTIKALDANGKSVTRSIKVDVAPPAIPPIAPGDPGAPPNGSTTGGTVGGGQ